MTKPAGIEKLHLQNHDLYRRVQHLVRLKWSWDAIADDAGLVGSRRVQDLCEWVLEYREPKQLPVVRTYPKSPFAGHPKASSQKVARQFVAWRRAHEGAAKTRAENA